MQFNINKILCYDIAGAEDEESLESFPQSTALYLREGESYYVWKPSKMVHKVY